MYQLLYVSAIWCHHTNIKVSYVQSMIQVLFTLTPFVKFKSNKMFKLQITHQH